MLIVEFKDVLFSKLSTSFHLKECVITGSKKEEKMDIFRYGKLSNLDNRG